MDHRESLLRRRKERAAISHRRRRSCDQPTSWRHRRRTSRCSDSRRARSYAPSAAEKFDWKR